MRILLSILLLSSGFSGSLFAQHPVMRHYTSDNGLPSNTVYCIVQDKLGYIWIGTDQGVARYDGQEFEVFTTREGLPSNDVWDLSQDEQGRLWLNTFRGLCYFDLQGKINCLDLPQKVQSIDMIRHEITAIGHFTRVYRGSEVDFFYHGDSLTNIDYRLRNAIPTYKEQITIIDSAEAKAFFPPRSPQHNNSKSLRIVFDQTLLEANTEWIKQPQHIYLERGLFEVLNFNQFASLSSEEVVLVQGNSAWIASNEGLRVLSLQHLWPDQTLPYIDAIRPLSPNRIWISSKAGNYIVDQNWQAITHYDFLRAMSINDITIDQQGNFWISSPKGIYFLNSVAQTSKTFQISNDPNEEIITQLTQHTNQGIWGLGSKGGVYQIDAQHGILPKYPKNLIDTPTDIGFDAQENLWASGRDLYRFSQNALITNHSELPFQNPILKGQFIKSIHFDSDNQLFICNYDNLSKVLVESAPRHEIIYGHRSYGLDFNADHTYWVSGQQGLELLDSTGQVIPFKDSGGSSILDRPIQTIKKGRRPNSLWIGTISEGLYLYANEQVYVVKELAKHSIKSLEFDRDSMLWVSTNLGLARLSDVSLALDSFQYNLWWYKELDGLASKNIKEAIRKEDKVYVATDDGLSILDYTPFEQTDARAFFISRLIVNGRQEPVSDGLQLSHLQNQLRIEFRCLDFKNRSNLSFSTKLEGIDPKWVEGQDFFREYISLPPGEYRFRVKRSPNKHLPIYPEIQFQFTIQPPWWKRRSFMISTALFFLFSIYGMVQFQIRRIKRKEREQTLLNKKFAELELSALQAQMNPHFIFNALHAIQDFIFRKDERIANRYLVKFSRLMRLFLESSKEKYILLPEEIQMLQLYIELEKLRFEDKFDFQINVSTELATSMIEIPSMLLQPFVENAINHGLIHRESGGLLQLDFQRLGDELTCIIEDNGIGRKKALEIKSQSIKSYKSRGLQLIEERQRVWEVIGKAAVNIEITDLESENGEALGTLVKIRIKLDE